MFWTWSTPTASRTGGLVSHGNLHNQWVNLLMNWWQEVWYEVQRLGLAGWCRSVRACPWGAVIFPWPLPVSLTVCFLLTVVCTEWLGRPSSPWCMYETWNTVSYRKSSPQLFPSGTWSQQWETYSGVAEPPHPMAAKAVQPGALPYSLGENDKDKRSYKFFIDVNFPSKC